MKKLLVLGAALPCLMFAVSAHAQDNNGGQKEVNVQVNTGHVVSNLNSTVTAMTGDVANTAAAIGNSYSVSGNATAYVADINNTQTTNQGIAATLNVTEATITGNVTDTAAAIGNSFSVNAGNVGQIENNQTTHPWDPSASLTQITDAVAGNITGTAAAIGNSASITTDYGHDLNNVDNTQSNSAPLNATLDAAIAGAGVTKSVNETAAAIGNSLSITGTVSGGAYTTDPLGDVTSTQDNWGKVTASLDASTAKDYNGNAINGVQGVDGAVTLTAAAIGNSLSFTGSIDGNLTTTQNNYGDISSTLKSYVGAINGPVTQTAAAIGNSVSVTVK